MQHLLRYSQAECAIFWIVNWNSISLIKKFSLFLYHNNDNSLPRFSIIQSIDEWKPLMAQVHLYNRASAYKTQNKEQIPFDDSIQWTWSIMWKVLTFQFWKQLQNSYWKTDPITQYMMYIRFIICIKKLGTFWWTKKVSMKNVFDAVVSCFPTMSHNPMNGSILIDSNSI